MEPYDDQPGSSDEDSGSGISGIESNSNLQIIEGISSAMEKVLKENGINNWAEQAGLADNGEWDKLKEYQDFLDGGRSV